MVLPAGGTMHVSNADEAPRVHTLESTPVSTRTKKFQPKARYVYPRSRVALQARGVWLSSCFA